MKLSRYNLVVDYKDGALLFNTLSQALIYVRKENTPKLKTFFENPKPRILSNGEIEALKKGMFVLDDDFDEIEFLKFRFNSYRYSDSYLRYTIVTTRACNFDCVYCYQKQLHEMAKNSKNSSSLNKEVENNILSHAENRLKEQKPNVLSVTFYGGEPLLNLKSILKISKKLKEFCENFKVKHDFSIITNGFFLTKNVVDSLSKVGVKTAVVTLDGTNVYHDKYRKTKDGKATFSKIFENLQYASKKMYIQIRVNLSKENIEDVKRLIDLVAEKKIRAEFNFQPIEIEKGFECKFEDSPLDIKEFAKAEMTLWKYIRKKIPNYPFEYFKKPRMARCDAPCKNSYVVDVDGRIYKCWGELGLPNPSGVISEKLQFFPAYFKWILYDPFEKEECKDCIVFPFCMGGCAFNDVVSEKLNSSPVKKPYSCISLKYNINEFVKLVADYKLKGGKTWNS